MILVTGATGNIGSEIVRLLLADNQRVRVLVRDPAKLGALAERVEVVVGDLMQPSTLPAAFAGIDRAFVMIPVISEIATVAPAVFEAARAAGVQHVVFLSSGTIQMRPPMTIGAWHLAGEAALKASGVAWTMLRPGSFASNSLRWVGSIQGQGAVFAPDGDHGAAVIDPRDIAAVAAKALTGEGHAGQTHVLTGPELISTSQQVAILAEVLGKPIRVVAVPEAGARAGMLKSGMPEVLADAVLEVMRPDAVSEPVLTTTIEDVTGQPARSYAAWARANLAAFAA